MRQKWNIQRLATAALLVGALCAVAFALACGSAEEETSDASAPAPAAPAAAPAPAAPAPAEPSMSDESVTILIARGIDVMDPAAGTEANHHYIRPLFGYLVAGGGGNKIEPGIAKSWEMDSDGKGWTFAIREVAAHNGETVNADDVYWDWQRRFGTGSDFEGNGGSNIEIAAEVNAVEKAGSDSVRITFDSIRNDWHWLMSEQTFTTFGAIVPQEYYESVGQDGFETDPVATGFMKYVSHLAGQEIVLERFDDHFFQPANGFSYDRRPSFKTLTMRVVPEPATRSAAIQSGEADIIPANLFMKEDIEGAGGRFIYQPEGSYSWIYYLDCWDTELWCNDKRVRQALEYAVDKDTIASSLYGEEMVLKDGWLHFTPSAMGYTPGVTTPHPYDVAKAQQLLDEAGHPNCEGLDTIEAWTWESGDMPLLPQQAEVVVKMWEDNLGCDFDLRVGDPGSIYAQRDNRELPGRILIRANEARYDTTSITRAMWCEGAARVCEPDVSEDDARLHNLVQEKVVNELDPETKLKNFQEVATVLREEGHGFSLFATNTPWAVGPRVKNWEPWPVVTYVTALWTIELE